MPMGYRFAPEIIGAARSPEFTFLSIARLCSWCLLHADTGIRWGIGEPTGTILSTLLSAGGGWEHQAPLSDSGSARPGSQKTMSITPLFMMPCSGY